MEQADDVWTAADGSLVWPALPDADVPEPEPEPEPEPAQEYNVMTE